VSDAKKAEKLAKRHQMQQMRPTMLKSNLKNTKRKSKAWQRIYRKHKRKLINLTLSQLNEVL